MESFRDLNAYLACNSYLGYPACATKEDYNCCNGIQVADVDAAELPHLHRWHLHISHLMSKFGMFDSRGSPIQDTASKAPVSMSGSANSSIVQVSSLAKQPKQQKQPKQAATKAPESRSLVAKVTHFCVLDFEKTCEDREKDAAWGPQEIIEFPSVLLARSPVGVVGQFESYVKATVNPALTKFCTELTGITQDRVNVAAGLKEVLGRHNKWLRENVPQEEDCIFVSCGDMDLKTSLPEDPNIEKTELPACYQRWLNIKKEFGLFYTKWYTKKGKQPRNMTEMLERLDITLEGHHHSGIDDCRNIAKVLERMIAEGWCPS